MVWRRARVGSLTDKAVKTAKRRRTEATLSRVNIGQEPPENVISFCVPARESTAGVPRRVVSKLRQFSTI